MLQAKDFKIVDQLSTLLGEMMDWYCNDSEDALITKVFVQYVDLLRICVATGSGLCVWDELRQNYVNSAIKRFKEMGVKITGDYQKSGIGTLKGHMLDHIIEKLR